MKILIIATLIILVTSIFATPLTSHAQIIIIPDCNLNPQHPFCQSQCSFGDPLPPWCEPPEPEPAHQPVLLVPGLAASHNFKLIPKDQAGGTWDFTPSIRQQWQPLIDRLTQEGYELNHDLCLEVQPLNIL